MRLARPLFPEWPRLARQMRAAPRRVFLTDFDGTLVRIRRAPGDAQLSKAMRDLLDQIREAGSTVGVVSGRGIEDLLGRVQLPDIWYVGSHGYRLRDPRGRTISLATAAQQRRVSRAARWLAPRLAPLANVYLDVKRAALAVHYRSASRPSARQAEHFVGELLEREPGMRLLAGKKVWELLPGETVNKWTAVRRLLSEENATAGSFVIYLGDDQTDESVFRGLRHGVSVVVGRRTNTAARYCLSSTGEVRDFVRRWLRVEWDVAERMKYR